MDGWIFRVMAALVVVCAPLLFVAAADADATDVTVSSIGIDPAVLMRGDTATVTLRVENRGETSVAVRRAYLLGEVNLIRTMNDPYATVGDIGAGNFRDFSFLVRADGPDGTYYPKFVLDFRDAGALTVPIPVMVKSTEPALSVLDRPDRFSRGKKDTVTVLIGNPRTSDLSGMNLAMEGEGLDITPASYFIGTLAPDASVTVSFNITPREEGNLSIVASYRNGVNLHAKTIYLPVTLDDDLRRASLIPSNLVVTREGGTYRMTGDVSNAGLEVANAVTVTAGGAAVPVDPFRFYVVGSLNPDDFASFEISFTARNASSVLLVLQFKDKDGRVFSGETVVPLSGASGPAQAAPSLQPLYLILGAVGIVVAGIIIWSWRKKR
jgi:hypothetical protein